jgi:hypothetical protein
LKQTFASKPNESDNVSEYQKINHGGDLLGKIDAKKVRRAAHFFEILFDVLAKKIG